MNKTLLFGSNGFLGSHLKEKLDGEVIGINIRQQNWQENILKKMQQCKEDFSL
jgi:nucleoside-diphosphate-sugar epimerase